MKSLEDFFKEFRDVEISIQSDRDYTKPEKINRYVRDLEDAIGFYTGQRLDLALGLFKKFRNQNIKLENNKALALEVIALSEKLKVVQDEEDKNSNS